METKKEWFCLEKNKWYKEIDHYRFVFLRTVQNAKAKYNIYSAFIDLWEYGDPDILECLRACGYDGYEDVNNHFKEKATLIIADCIFEEMCLIKDFLINKEPVSQKEMENYLVREKILLS